LWCSLRGLCYGFGQRKRCGFLNLRRPAIFTSCALGPSPSQDRSVDFLHNTISMIIQARLSVYMNYSEIGYTHKLDRTTVTVGAPSMLAISTSPASAGVSSSTRASPGSTAPAIEEGSGLLSSVDARSSSATAACYAASSTVASVVGAGLRLLSVAPPTVPGFFFPLVHWVGRRNILRQLKIQLSAYSTLWKVLDYTTRGTHLLGG
jgi:hypothetical protein